jgi:hypothetical protein
MPEAFKSPEQVQNIDAEVLRLAILSGQIKVKRSYYFKFGTIDEYSGEGTVELGSIRYKIIGYPTQHNENGEPIRTSWLQIFKLQPWQK